MKDKAIEKYLSEKKCSLCPNILKEIEDKRQYSINNKDEDAANYYWCMREIYIIQDAYIRGYYEIRKHLYEEAWRSFDLADIKIGSLIFNYNIGTINDDYFHINFIRDIIKEYCKLFPYRLFISRESIIHKEVCSICGETVQFRGGCKHKAGKLYMGEYCYYKVVDSEITGFAIVESPFDRYAYLKPVGREFNYEMLDFLIRELESPYEKWHVNTNQKVIAQDYINVGRNEQCPCGSGKKFKKCCMGTERMYTTHYDIVYDDKPFTGIIMPLRYTSTYKN